MSEMLGKPYGKGIPMLGGLEAMIEVGAYFICFLKSQSKSTQSRVNYLLNLYVHKPWISKVNRSVYNLEMVCFQVCDHF